MKNPLRRKGKKAAPSTLIDDEEAIRHAIALSLLDMELQIVTTDPPQEDVQVTEPVLEQPTQPVGGEPKPHTRPPVPAFNVNLTAPLTTFEQDLKKAIELSLQEEQTLHRTSAEADLRRAVALSLESARRKGYSLSDPEEDLLIALNASVKSAGLEGVGDELIIPPPEPEPPVLGEAGDDDGQPDEPANTDADADGAVNPDGDADAQGDGADDGTAAPSAEDDAKLAMAIEKSLSSALRKITEAGQSPADFRPTLQSQVKRTVAELMQIQTVRMKAETPGRSAIQPGTVAAKRQAFS